MGSAANCSLEGAGGASFLPTTGSAPGVVLALRLRAASAAVQSGAGLIRFRLVDAGDLFTSGERRRAKGEKASPLAIPGLGVCRLPGWPRAAGCPSPAGSHTPSMAWRSLLRSSWPCTGSIQPATRPGRRRGLRWSIHKAISHRHGFGRLAAER